MEDVQPINSSDSVLGTKLMRKGISIHVTKMMYSSHKRARERGWSLWYFIDPTNPT